TTTGPASPRSSAPSPSPAAAAWTRPSLAPASATRSWPTSLTATTASSSSTAPRPAACPRASPCRSRPEANRQPGHGQRQVVPLSPESRQLSQKSHLRGGVYRDRLSAPIRGVNNMAKPLLAGALAMALLASLGLGACANKEESGTAIGAITGGIIGNQFGK